MTKEFHNAFPFVAPRSLDPETGNLTAVDIWPGMSLRDYFAAQAIGAIIDGVCNKHFTSQTGSIEVLIADHAYKIADAMIARRAEGGGA